MKSDEFRCKQCGGVFDEERTEEKALAEYWKIFGKLPDELKKDKAELCNDCYAKLMNKAQAMRNIVKEKEALTRDGTLCIASDRNSTVIIRVIYYLSRKNFFPANFEKVDTQNMGTKLIMTNNGAGSAVTIMDTRHRDFDFSEMDKCSFSRGKSGARLAGFEPAA